MNQGGKSKKCQLSLSLFSEYSRRSSNRKLRSRDKSRDGFRDKFKMRIDLECYYCGKKIHITREYMQLKRE